MVFFGKSVVDVVWDKHPIEQVPKDFEELGPLPLLITLDISEKIVEKMSKKIRGGADPY